MSVWSMQTMHEIAMKSAKKQPGIVDCILEKAPILDMMRWKAASHKLWNVAEILTDVTGPAFVKPDSPLPFMQTSTDLFHIDLQVMGGRMSCPTLRAIKVGGGADGWRKYFADRQPRILRKMGMDTEIQIVEKNWLRGAIEEGTLIDAKGTGAGWYILAVRFDEETNVGLYDPDQFEQGRFLKISFPYDGAEHYLPDPQYEGVLGYEVVYRGNWGWQLLDAKRTVGAIVNIDESHLPTPTMIDELLLNVRAGEGPTYLFMSPKAKLYAMNPYKLEKVQLANGDTDAKTMVDTWNGIRIVTSYNIMDPIAHINVE